MAMNLGNTGKLSDREEDILRTIQCNLASYSESVTSFSDHLRRTLNEDGMWLCGVACKPRYY